MFTGSISIISVFSVFQAKEVNTMNDHIAIICINPQSIDYMD